MSVAAQARNPESILCRFLDRSLPQRGVVAEDWVRRAASAPWQGIDVPDAQQQIGVAAEIRIGLDLGAIPAYWNLLSFLPRHECCALLSAAEFSSNENENLADTRTTDPLLREWHRVHKPIDYDDDQRAALAACWDAAGMRDLALAFSERPAQVRRSYLVQIRGEIATSEKGRTRHDAAVDGLAHLWKGYLRYGRQRLTNLGNRVLLAPELGGGYGIADLVVGRCLVEIKTAIEPAANFSHWLNQVLGYALLDWSDALGIDTIAIYLGWQALLVSESLAHVLSMATVGSTPSLDNLRADFRHAMQADMDEAFGGACGTAIRHS